MPRTLTTESALFAYLRSYAASTGDALYKNDTLAAGLVATRAFVGFMSHKERAFIEYHPSDAALHRYYLTTDV